MFRRRMELITEERVITIKESSPTLLRFDDKDKLIRVGGRVQFSELPEETKHQIILPAKHTVVDKIITYFSYCKKSWVSLNTFALSNA